MPESGTTLQGLTATHPEAAKLRQAYEAVGLQGVAAKEGPAGLCAMLETPKGRVKLDSEGL
jgi:hypothetical protein